MTASVPRPAARTSPGGFRQAMAWLHTWCGLYAAWLLFAVFLTGTLAVFEEPISHWMTPEHAMEEAHEAGHGEPPAPVTDRARRLAHGVAFMAQAHPRADMWEIWPANRGAGNGLFAYWFDKTGGYASAQLDPVTGQPIPPGAQPPRARETEGGHHFVEFHYQLHAGNAGLWATGFAAMAMLVALVSGVVTHKRIFKDFFTFRPRKGQRSWLDAHNALGALTLPFQFMIAYTGLVISVATLMPAGTLAQYGEGPSNRARYLAELTDPGKPARSGQPLAVPELEPFVARAERLMGQQARAIVIDHPGDAAMRIAVYGWNEEAELLTRISGTTAMASFSAATGQLLHSRAAGDVDGGAAALTQTVMADLHMAGFGGLPLKWLYFLCGLAGTAMMGSGAVLFMVKRRQKQGSEFGAATARAYRVIEGLNVAAIAGLMLACIGFLWANRLVPVGLEHRADWELRCFFGLWLLALGHAFVRPPRRAWIEQLGAAAALCVALPLLNLLTTGDHLPAQIARGDWESAGVELTALAFGGLLGRVVRGLQRRGAPSASTRWAT